MYLTWHGLSCIKIISQETVIILDPFEKTSGLNAPRFGKVDIIAYSHQGDGLKKPTGQVFVVNGPGEYETRGVFIRGVGYPAKNKELLNQTAYHLEIEGMTLAHLGYLNEQLSDDQLDIIEGVDILFIPVGGKDVLSAEQAVLVMNQIEPRIVIPMHYQDAKMKVKYDPLSGFLKEVGKKDAESYDKFRVVKKELPQEETRIVILKSI